MTIRVAQAEADLLAVARAIVTRDAYTSIEPILASAPISGRGVAQLSPAAMSVLERTLARGVVKMLAQLGGASARRRPGHPGRVRVFDVRPPPAIAFGAWTFELLRWLTVAQLGAREVALPFTATPETLGDQIVAYLALRLVEGRRLERAVASSTGLVCPLTWLGFPRMLARHHAIAPVLGDLLATDDARTVVECLELDVARRWAEPWAEADVVSAEIGARSGGAERTVLDAYLQAIEGTDRWDLAHVVVAAGARALPPHGVPRDLAVRAVPRMKNEGTLRSRNEARRKSGALFVALARIGKKREELGLVRFIDDGYETAQAILAAWEVLPREAHFRAEGVLSVLASLEDLGGDTLRGSD